MFARSLLICCLVAAAAFAPSTPAETAPPDAPPSTVRELSAEPSNDPVGEEDPNDTPPASDAPAGDGSDPAEPGDPDDEERSRSAVEPQVRSSDIPTGSIVISVAVLVAMALLATVAGRRRTDEPTSDAEVPEVVSGSDGIDTIDFIVQLGAALVDTGDSVGHVEATLRTVGRVNGIHDMGVIVLPTALVISIPGRGQVTTEVGRAGGATLRLDQIDDLLRLVQLVERGRLGPDEGAQRLAAIRAAPAPFSPAWSVLGYVVATVGLAAVLHADTRELLIAAPLGLLVGWLRLATHGLRPTAQPFVTLIAAGFVSVSVLSVARVVDDLTLFPLLVSPLVFFLPGALLTIAVLELATGHMVSGTSRLAAGALQLVLLALGIVGGIELTGIPAGDVRSGLADGLVAELIPWVGIALFGIGVAWFTGARPGARRWMLVVLYVAYAGQVVGGLFFGSALSAFFGALAMTPVALVAARQRSGPTPLVTFLPGFWILVPGALGLEGVSRVIGEGGFGSGTLVTTLTSMVGIALGILLGLIISAHDPERPWSPPSVE